MLCGFAGSACGRAHGAPAAGHTVYDLVRCAMRDGRRRRDRRMGTWAAGLAAPVRTAGKWHTVARYDYQGTVGIEAGEVPGMLRTLDEGLVPVVGRRDRCPGWQDSLWFTQYGQRRVGHPYRQRVFLPSRTHARPSKDGGEIERDNRVAVVDRCARSARSNSHN